MKLLLNHTGYEIKWQKEKKKNKFILHHHIKQRYIHAYRIIITKLII